MIRSLLAVVLLSLTGVALSSVPMAQTTIGFRAGLNVSTLVGPTADDFEAILGLVGGPYVRYDIVGPLSVQTELLLAQNGARPVETQGSGSRLVYVETPFLLVLRGPTIRTMLPTIYAGPSAGFAISGEILDGSDTARSPVLGLVAGTDVSAQLRGRDEQFGIGVRYAIGISAVTEIGGEAVRHRVFSIVAHFQL